jgi:hypothetical protein
MRSRVTSTIRSDHEIKSTMAASAAADNPAPAPAPAPALAPAPVSATVSAVTLVADKTTPQATNVPVTFTATPAGGSAPHQYQWLVNDGTGWAPVGTWTTSSQFVWTPATANAGYFVGVRVRSAGHGRRRGSLVVDAVCDRRRSRLTIK